MFAHIPRVLGFSPFKEVGFYDFLFLRECTLKAMQKNLITEPAFPEQVPSRHSLVGLFHHRVMELVFKVTTLTALEVAIEEEISTTQKIVDSWRHLRRSGSVSGWDEINTSATLARRLYMDVQSISASGSLGLEKKLRSLDGKLVGRPDFFYIAQAKAVLRELKSSSLRNDERQVREEYLKQIQFYALLIFDSFPVSVVEAALESSRGEHISFTFERQDIEPIRSAALASIERANLRISSAKAVEDLATPSTSACRDCQKRPVCELFKKRQLSLGLDGDVFVLEGLVAGIVRKADGKTLEISLKEEFSGESYILTLPALDGDGFDLGKRYLFSDLAYHAGKFRWSERTRVFACD